jgi:hypothetical protein
LNSENMIPQLARRGASGTQRNSLNPEASRRRFERLRDEIAPLRDALLQVRFESLDSSLGSIQDYEAQQAAAAELGNYGIVQAPSVIIAAPVGRYYARRTFASAAPVFGPTARVAPRSSIVLPRLPRTVGGAPRGFFGGFRGDGFSHMSGIHGGFGHMSGVHGGFGHR